MSLAGSSIEIVAGDLSYFVPCFATIDEIAVVASMTLDEYICRYIFLNMCMDIHVLYIFAKHMYM